MKLPHVILSLVAFFRDHVEDRAIERDRYNNKAALELQELMSGDISWDSLHGIHEMHHRPYIEYYRSISAQISSVSKVLELASGTGRHSLQLLETGGEIWALDISEMSLEVLRIRSGGKINTVCGEIGNTPFKNETFDFVVSCGGLSYEDNEKLLEEVIRILKPGGGVIFLDTLNHNPIYRMNRFIHFLKGNRTYSTLRHMPRLKFLRQISSKFETSELRTFGNLLWVYSFFLKISRDRLALAKFQEDSTKISKWGFKFLFTAQKLKK